MNLKGFRNIFTFVKLLKMFQYANNVHFIAQKTTLYMKIPTITK